MPATNDNDFSQQIAEADSVEEIFKIIENTNETALYISNSYKRTAIRNLKKALDIKNKFHDQDFIERYIPDAFGVREKYFSLLKQERIYEANVAAQSELPVLRIPHVNSIDELIEQYKLVSSNSTEEHEIEYVQQYIRRILTNPELLQKIITKNLDWDRYNIPDQYSLRDEINYLAIIVSEQNKNRLLSDISQTKSTAELMRYINDNSILIDSIEFAGGTAPIMSDMIRFMHNPHHLATLHDGTFLDWDQYPTISSTPILLSHFKQLAISHEALQRKALSDRVEASGSFDELLSTIQSYQGDLKKPKLIKSINSLVNNKKNIEYIAQEGVFDWKQQGIIEQFGIREKIVQLSKVRYASTPKAANYSPSPIIEVNETEWQSAAVQFAANLDLLKLDKKTSDLSHSFLKIGSEIYAIQTNDYLGEGNYGKVKLIMNQSSEQYAVKIEGVGLEAENSAEKKIMAAVGLYVAELQRLYGKEFKGRFTEHKRYTIMKLLEGHELHDHLYFGQRLAKREVNETERIVMAIKAAEAIQFLHDKRIIHCDIKPENFMINVIGEQITISSFDFGFSIELNAEQEWVTDKPKGTDFYLAPEIEEAKYSGDPEALALYSFASDVFALGKMFDYDLALSSVLPSDILEQMMAPNPQERAKLPMVMDALYSKLAQCRDKTPEINAMLEVYNVHHQENIIDKPPATNRVKAITTLKHTLTSKESKNSTDTESLSRQRTKSKGPGFSSDS